MPNYSLIALASPRVAIGSGMRVVIWIDNFKGEKTKTTGVITDVADPERDDVDNLLIRELLAKRDDTGAIVRFHRPTDAHAFTWPQTQTRDIDRLILDFGAAR